MMCLRDPQSGHTCKPWVKEMISHAFILQFLKLFTYCSQLQCTNVKAYYGKIE